MIQTPATHFQSHSMPYRPSRFSRYSRTRPRPRPRILAFCLRWAIRFGLVGVIAGAVLLFAIARALPDPTNLTNREVEQSTKILDRTGKTVLYEVHGSRRRTAIALEEIPPAVKWATVAAEDKDFFTHRGFDLTGIIRALLVNALRGEIAQGGSTLTQQFIKNSILTTERTWQRKIRELILAYRIEQRFTKEEILKLYLNEIPYGRNAYGIEAAAATYFGKRAADLSLAESALLAALPKAPSYYSPYGANKDELLNRQHYILRLMAEQGYISREEEIAAKKAPLELKTPREAILAPHFVLYVRELLENRYGADRVERGGLRVTTTLDLEKQRLAEKLVSDGAKKNERQFGGKNASLVALDPKTGQILAMVGSRDYFDEATDGAVNVALRPRQPGSSIKPFVYAAAFEKGYTTETPLYDVVTKFQAYPKDYEPHNYDNKEHGRVTMRSALAGSLNIPAVKTLYLTGIDRVLAMLERVGYSTFKERSRFGLSLVLGGGEVKLLEHVAAFGVLSQEGAYRAPSAILSVADASGAVLETFRDEPRQAMPREIAQTVTSVLSDNNARAFIFGVNNLLTLPDRPVAAKTGTTNDFRDAWTIGFTPSLVAGVWAGNNDNKPMRKKADGSMIAAPIFNAFMKESLKGTVAETFPPPPPLPEDLPSILSGKQGGDTVVKIDRASGKRATERTPATFIEERRYQEPRSILHSLKKDDPRGSPPTNPNDDPEYSRWEEAIARWAKINNVTGATPPSEFDDLHIPENVPQLAINSPQENEMIKNNDVTISFTTTAPRGVRRVEIRLDDALLQTILDQPITSPHSLSLSLPTNLETGFHTISLRAYDDIDNLTEVKRTINVLRPQESVIP